MKYFKDLIVGFDVASNELHASPEVFSPIFGKLSRLELVTITNIKNIIYYVG
jgi:hypothetical protein